MKTARQKKCIAIVLMMGGCAIAIALLLSALKDNINLFYTPSELQQNRLSQKANIQLGGMVKQGSVKRDSNSLKIEFTVTDFKHEITVIYEGILPNLFREGQGVVVQGNLRNGQLAATTVLAKHDENYMPPKVAEALKTKTPT